jgi:Xaa-Pro aminopeptidase
MRKKAALKKSLARSGVNGLLVTDLANVRYLTGFSGSSGFLLITQNIDLFITDFRYKEQASQQVKGCRVIIENSERSKEIKALCDKFKVSKLGFESHDIKYDFHKRLSGQKIRLKPLKETIEALRIIKSKKEISCIRVAVKRAEKAYRRLIQHVKKGVTERNLALRLEGYLREEGSEKLPFDAIVASGPMSALPHASPSDRKLKAGDLVVIDWGGECDGYFSDMTRTLLIKGRDTDKQKFIYSTVLCAYRNAVNAVKPACNASEVDAAARDYIKNEDLDDFFGHATGHGVGLAVHEKPIVSWRSKDAIKNGMVFTVEPGIYIPDLGGVRIENMVLVTRNGAETLNKLSTRLKIIKR